MHALVTGAARGVGFGIARAFADSGATVTIADVDAAGADRAASRIGGDAWPCAVDVSDPVSVIRAFAAAEERNGPVRVLVNNAGICTNEDFVDVKPDSWNRVVAVNLTGCFHCMRAAVPKMIEGGGGKIVNIGSFAGRTGGIMVSAAYSASKAGVGGLTKAAAKQLAKHRIQVNCVAPSTLETDMTADWDAERLAAVERTIPAGRLGTVADVVGTVLFLCSPEADYLTGVTIDVTGGLFVAP
jgi:NAD(P)-dependent dehydrogenase (short-subunit alcohol dehydrogenase family)